MLNSAHKIPTVFFFSTPFAMQKKSNMQTMVLQKEKEEGKIPSKCDPSFYSPCLHLQRPPKDLGDAQGVESHTKQRHEYAD